MDAPVWTNDLLYLKEMIIIMIITVAMIAVCFTISQREDRKRALRLARRAAQPVTTEETPPPRA